jgi:hypothetical protein
MRAQQPGLSARARWIIRTQLAAISPGRKHTPASTPGPSGSSPSPPPPATRSHRDHPWRGSGPPPLRNRVKRPYLITDAAWNSASRPSFGSQSGVRSWYHGSFGMSRPAEMGAAGSQGRRPSGAVPTLGCTERFTGGKARVSAETACESLHKALPRKRRPSASKRPEARRSRTCRT